MLNISRFERYFILSLIISGTFLISLSYRHKIISANNRIEAIEIKDEQAPININTATAEQLEYLPGIGPVLANDIILYREKLRLFKGIKELRGVKGIGDRKFEGLRGLITTGD